MFSRTTHSQGLRAVRVLGMLSVRVLGMLSDPSTPVSDSLHDFAERKPCRSYAPIVQTCALPGCLRATVELV